MTKYIISDLHFNHNKEFIYAARGFSSMEEHDVSIVNRINSVVQEDDELYILGDIAMGRMEDVGDPFKNINCKNITIILGNHESVKKIEFYESSDKVVEVVAAKYLRDKKWTFYLSHFPTMTSNYDDNKHSPRNRLWNLSGHTHSNNIYENFNCGVINCSVDAFGYPHSLDEIRKLILEGLDANRKAF